MEVLYFTHPAFREHRTGAWHPERPDRLVAVERGVMASGLEVDPREPPLADQRLLTLVHTPAYVESIRRFCESGGGALDPDTVAGPGSWEAARRAAGAGPAAVEALRGGAGERTALLAVRPPGHHALADRAMGFCLFNNVALTARVLAAGGERVAIVDWDVHHGNGTQAAFYTDPGVLYISLHQYPFYPFTGAVDEVGEGEAEGTTINCPLPAGTGGDVYRTVFAELVKPVLLQFRPEWILVSTGYDGHEDDPLAEIRLVADDYAVMAAAIAAVVGPHRIVFFLEGGYNLAALTSSVAATLRGVFGKEVPGPPRSSPAASWEAAEKAFKGASRYWRL